MTIATLQPSRTDVSCSPTVQGASTLFHATESPAVAEIMLTGAKLSATPSSGGSNSKHAMPNQ